MNAMKRIKKTASQVIYYVAGCVVCTLYIIPWLIEDCSKKPPAKPRCTRPPLYPEPKPLPPRIRSLTLPLENEERDQQTLKQSHSRFLTTLPLEIRWQIYKEVLGGAIIHLQYYSKPLAKRCLLQKCTHIFFEPQHETRLDFSLAILRTCRQIYSEAIEFLYSANLFSISNALFRVSILPYLSGHFLPQRLSQLRNLRVFWETAAFHANSEDKRENCLKHWYNAWDAIAGLVGLRQLHFQLHLAGGFGLQIQERWREKEEEMFLPLKLVVNPTDFVVVLPFRECSKAIDVKPSHCVFLSPENNPLGIDLWA